MQMVIGSPRPVRAASVLALVAVAGCARAATPPPSVLIAPAPEAPATAAPPATARTGGVPASRLVTECIALVEIINRGVAAMEKSSSNDPTGIADLEEMAAKLDAVARALDGVQLTVPSLRERGEAYRAMSRTIAAAERALVDAVRRKDAKARASAENDLDAALKKEDPLVDEINRICQGAR